ncbi:hypothetical protein [Candidatus Thalassolituus haligoni]|jgi:hypothetical protein|uniref:hypothetical protein n=1 Tax=Candidatus Thalassolituus haligoni TaxID=3100113 RepID=UPI00351652AE
MTVKIEVSLTLYQRLEALASGFDSPSNVIERLLDRHEKSHCKSNCSDAVPEGRSSGSRLFTNKEIQQRISLSAKNMPSEVLEAFCGDVSSKEQFGLSFPLFVRVPSTVDPSTKKALVKSKDGVSRWTWKYEFERDGYLYAICTQWYRKNDADVQKFLAVYE